MSTVVTPTPSVEIIRLARDLARLGGDASRSINREYKGAVTVVARDAARRASWSTRIPPAIKVQTARSKVHPGADIRVSGLPHARLYEGLTRGGRGHFRHKTFGRGGRTGWVSQATRPYIRPAAAANQEPLKRGVDAAVIAAAKAQGWT